MTCPLVAMQPEVCPVGLMSMEPSAVAAARATQRVVRVSPFGNGCTSVTRSARSFHDCRNIAVGIADIGMPLGRFRLTFADQPCTGGSILPVTISTSSPGCGRAASKSPALFLLVAKTVFSALSACSASI